MKWNTPLAIIAFVAALFIVLLVVGAGLDVLGVFDREQK